MDLSEVNEICNRQSKKIAELEKDNAELVADMKRICNICDDDSVSAERALLHIMTIAKQEIDKAEGK